MEAPVEGSVTPGGAPGGYSHAALIQKARGRVPGSRRGRRGASRVPTVHGAGRAALASRKPTAASSRPWQCAGGRSLRAATLPLFPSLAGQGEGERAAGSPEGVLCRERWACRPLSGVRHAPAPVNNVLAFAAPLTAQFWLFASAGQPLEDGWRVEVKIRTTGTSLGTTDAVSALSPRTSIPAADDCPLGHPGSGLRALMPQWAHPTYWHSPPEHTPSPPPCSTTSRLLENDTARAWR